MLLNNGSSGRAYLSIKKKLLAFVPSTPVATINITHSKPLVYNITDVFYSYPPQIVFHIMASVPTKKKKKKLPLIFPSLKPQNPSCCQTILPQ